MNTKLKLQKKKLLYMGALSLMLACSNINDSYNEDKYNKNVNNQTYYRREQVYLIFDMATGKCQEFLLNKKENAGYVLEEIYDLENSNIKFSEIVKKEEHDVYYNYLKSNPSIIFLSDLDKYFSNIDIKEYYTLNEIKFLEPYIFNTIADNYLDKVLSK